MHADMEPLKPVSESWTTTQKVLFRLLFSYAVLYMMIDGIFGFLFHVIPLIGLWDEIIYWAGEHVLSIGYEITEKPNGSGDTTYNYVQLFVITSLSIILTIGWSFLDRQRTNYDALLDGLYVFVRHYLGCVMLMYGLAKVFKTQFPYPNEFLLNRTYGESSPMGLLWSFMGYSYPYNLFTGLGEVVGGLLLFWRRTTLLGSLIVIGVMSNVVVINFSYDVPVKLFSSHLLLMAFFLVAPDLQRLYRFFVLNESVPAGKHRTFDINTHLGMLGTMVKIVALVAVILINLVSGLNRHRNPQGTNKENIPLYGNYDVVNFESYVFHSRLRWKSLLVHYPGRAIIETADGSVDNISFNPNPSNQKIAVYAFTDSLMTSTLTYKWTADSLLNLEGSFKGDSIKVTLKPKSGGGYTLTDRGFHWINERPFNR